jgi:hypothetical protein
MGKWMGVYIMAKSTIMLQNRDTKEYIPIEVTSYATDKPGLFVHREAYLGFNNEIRYVSKSWVISHIGSGMSIKPYWHTIDTRKEALEIAAQYPDIDWTKSADELYVDLRNCGKKVLDVYKERML